MIEDEKIRKALLEGADMIGKQDLGEYMSKEFKDTVEAVRGEDDMDPAEEKYAR